MKASSPIVVSEEAKDYRPEMTWLAKELSARGHETYCVEPRRDSIYRGTASLATHLGDLPIGLIYRFYELFDLPNIPKADLIQYAVKKSWVGVTPPYKPALEEKSAFALLAPSLPWSLSGGESWGRSFSFT